MASWKGEKLAEIHIDFFGRSFDDVAQVVLALKEHGITDGLRQVYSRLDMAYIKYEWTHAMRASIHHKLYYKCLAKMNLLINCLKSEAANADDPA